MAVFINGDDIVAVDFDGVIHACSKGHQDGSIYDDPIPGAKAGLEYIEKMGYRVIIVTARKNVWDIPAWLKKHGFNDYFCTNVKPPAKLYIDDKAMRFDQWENVTSYFLRNPKK